MILGKTDKVKSKCADMLFEKYKMFTLFKEASCKQTNVFLDVLHDIINQTLSSAAFQNWVYN